MTVWGQVLGPIVHEGGRKGVPPDQEYLQERHQRPPCNGEIVFPVLTTLLKCGLSFWLLWQLDVMGVSRYRSGWGTRFWNQPLHFIMSPCYLEKHLLKLSSDLASEPRVSELRSLDSQVTIFSEVISQHGIPTPILFHFSESQMLSGSRPLSLCHLIW